VRGWLSAVLLALPLLAQAAPAKRNAVEADLATKAAMDAFFALDGAVPRVVEPGEPDAPAAEARDHEDLIETLAEQLARGARLDRYRWNGTMLHHSLRAGFGDVTQWLLDHGADPLQTIQGEGWLDALGVAVRMQRWPWVRKLLRHPSYRQLPAEELAKRLWAGAVTDVHTQALLQLKLGVPKAVAQESPLLVTALRARDATVVDRLLAGRAGRVALDYPLRASEPRVPEVWPLQRWRQLDARLLKPVLPWALERAGSEAEVRALLGAGLRAPWSDVRFSADVARSLPMAALPRLLLDPPRGVDLGHVWGYVSRERASELRGMPPDDWRAYVLAAPAIDIVMNSLNLVAGSDLRERAQRAGAPPAEVQAWQVRWAPLVERLRALPAQRRRELWVDPNWRLYDRMSELPPAFLPDFIAWAAADDALQEALPIFAKSLQPQDYDILWAALQRHAPDLSGELLPALLSRLWVDPPRSRLADRMTGWSAGNVSLARWLLPRSPKITPRRLRAGLLSDDSGWSDADLVRWALAEGLALRPEPAKLAAASTGSSGTSLKASTPHGTSAGPVALRLVTEPLDCTAVVSPGLRRVLAQLTLATQSWVYDQEKLGWLQPVAAPRLASCQWLRTSAVVTGGSWSDESFFDGFATHMARGSIEQTLNLERWDEASERFAELQGFPFVTQLLEVELTPRGDRFWLGTESDANGRRGPGAYLLSWHADKPVFEAVPQGAVLDDAWRSLINPDKTGDVFDLVPEDPHAAGPRVPVPIARFVDAHWADEKQRFLAAFVALDREALSAQWRAGLFAPWLNEAVVALSADAGQPLEARRRRMAWLLALPAYAGSLTEESLSSLRGWLPAEDWGPILALRRCSKDNLFSRSDDFGLSEWSNEAPPALRRRIEVALARDCDGVVR